MLRIALAAQDFPPRRGGTAVYNVEYATRLARRGHEVTVFTWGAEAAALPPGDRELPFEVRRSAAGRGRTALDPTELREFLDSWRPDVVLASGSSAAMGPVIRRAADRAPVAVTVHDIRDKGSRRGALRRFRNRWRYGFEAATRLLPTSRHNRACLLRLGVAEAKIEIVHPGVDTAHFAPDPAAGAELRAREGLGSGPLLLTVSRLAKNKGHATVISALPRLRTRFPDVRYAVVGEGPTRASLEALAERAGVADAVRFVGGVADARPWYNACDIFVMPSTPRRGGLKAGEGFGIAYLEAGACGKPAVASSSGGGAEIVVDGETGRVVEPRDEAGVAAALESMLAAPDRARAWGERARGRALGFDWSRGEVALEAALEETVRHR